MSVYYVDYICHGHWAVEVEASSKDEALDKAESAWCNENFGSLSDIEGRAYYIENLDVNSDIVGEYLE